MSPAASSKRSRESQSFLFLYNNNLFARPLRKADDEGDDDGRDGQGHDHPGKEKITDPVIRQQGRIVILIDIIVMIHGDQTTEQRAAGPPAHDQANHGDNVDQYRHSDKYSQYQVVWGRSVFFCGCNGYTGVDRKDNQVEYDGGDNENGVSAAALAKFANDMVMDLCEHFNTSIRRSKFDCKNLCIM